MKNRKNVYLRMFQLGILVAGLVGCQTMTSSYQRYDVLTGGYAEKENSPGVWEIQYIGGKDDLASRGAAYRSAELTFEKGCRYFVVIKADDESGLVYGSKTGYGSRASVYLGNCTFIIKISKEKPQGKSVDAYELLNNVPVPNTKKPNTVKNRLWDREHPSEKK